MMAFRLFLANGTTNLVVVVSFLIFCIGLIPMILWISAVRNAREAKALAATRSGSSVPPSANVSGVHADH